MEYNANTNTKDCHDTQCVFTLPESLSKNTFAFGGNQTLEEDKVLGGVGSSISYHTTAKKVHLVLGHKIAEIRNY